MANPISKTELNNASTDANSLSVVTNGDDVTNVTSRLGRVYPTIAKLFKGFRDSAAVVLTQIGYAVPVTYASAIVLTSPNQTVSYNGVVYAPISNQLPFTTSGTFETAKFRIIQGVAAIDLAKPGAAALVGSTPVGSIAATTVQGAINELAEIKVGLAAATGASLVGFQQEGTGAVPTTVQSKLREFVSVKDFGAVGDGVTDDYPAFLAALATRKAIYVPKGTGAYRLGTALDVTNTVMFGDGVEASRIESVNSDVTKPVMYLGGNSCLRNLDIGFSPSVMTGVESAGQRPALILHSPSSGLPLQRGAAISNIRIRICGTGVYDPPSTGPYTYFSVTFDGIEIRDFSYRGWDARSSIRTGNKYDNIYIGNAGGAYISSSNVDCGFFLGGEESEAAFGQINVEWMRGGSAVSLTGVRAIAGGSFHIEQFTQINAYAAVVAISRSSGFIGSVTAYYCPINTVGWQLLKLGDSTYDGALANPTTCDYIRIGTLHVKGLNDGSQVTGGVGLTGLTDMAFAQREVSTVGPYALQIDNYVWNTYKADQAVYQNFPSDPHSRIRSIATLGGPPIGRGVVAGVNYVRRADGVIELTGAISVGANSSTTVVFPTIPGETVAGFPAACQFATVEPDDTGPSTYRYSAGVRSQTQFTVKSTAAGTITGFWRATGY